MPALANVPRPAATTPRLPQRALYEEVAELLRQRIYKRELEPGSWIDELKIAQEYDISRTPLREALKVLAAEGLVTMKVRRGAYVTEVSTQDLADVYHIRLCCRAAEISLVEAQHLMNATGRNQATRRLLQEVMRYITRAEELVGRLQPGSKHVRNQRIGVSKVRIWATSLEGDPESLADNLRMLHDLGWSAWRSAPTVLAVLAENENHRRSPGISEPVRRTIRDALELQPSLAWAGNSGVQDRIWTTHL